MEKRFMDSPIDLLRNGRLLRAKDLGLTPTANSSLELNQSFPRLTRKLKSVSKVQFSKALLNTEDMNSVSFSTQATQSSFHPDNQSNIEDTLNISHKFSLEDAVFNPNPHKGVLTIDSKTSQIIITNTIACKMLGYSSDELITKKFRDLVIKEKSQLALTDMIFNEKGEVVIFNGKVIELKCKDDSKVAVSCWLTNTEDSAGNSLYIAVIEPVQRIVSYLLLDEFGLIMSADDTASSLFHCTEERFVGHNIIKWIPNIIWPASSDDLDQEKKIQKTTGSNESKQSFPLTLRLDHYEGDSVTSLSETTSLLPSYSATIWVFTNLSGMLLVTTEGLIIDCNSIFAQLALGYSREQLIGKDLGDVLLNYSNAQSGHFGSEAHHENGSFIPVSYFVNGPIDGTDIYQVWMAIASSVSNCKSTLDASELSSRNFTANQSEREISKSENHHESKESSINREDMYGGDYSENYQFIKQIGSGGFGSVQLAHGIIDNKLVVTKFIKKSTVYSDSWVVTEDGHRLPNEIYLLNRIQHPFIVNMIEFFENDSYFQLVMEKHGFGMDLFEFIEKTNGVPEPLGANIAKQLVDAVDYLHSKGILHRDIKDENVVLDDQFHAKLIDFGSATYISDKPFKAFCGTFEYCSPEVLKGNPYRGPELEVWAMGVTIYVLIFGRNPFAGIEDILKSALEFPDSASSDLRDLLNGMMNRCVEDRFSVCDALKSKWLNQTVFLDNYDFYDICDLERSRVEFQNSRYIIDEGPVISLTTSTPYRKSNVPAKRSLDNSSFDIRDESVHFQASELVFNDISID
ncbi:PAS domain-containing serine/threonine-protein kinase-like [Daphnia pulicaria]|nr:PAS domain-containing serine/threonine-protein kinase-like [Daphnia pulicaria]